jgi:hypothetical protein
MPKRIIPLSEVKIRTTKPRKNEYKLFDGGGLYLLVIPSGGKYWHFKYRFNGKDKRISFGPYPKISLAEARMRRDEARSQIAHGTDRGVSRKAMKQAESAEGESFEVVALEWH